MLRWKRGVSAALVAVIVAGATLVYSTAAAAAGAAPTVTVVGSASCNPTVVGYLTVNFTVSQGPGPDGQFASLKASPLSTVNGPQNALTSGTPAVFRVLASVPDAAWAKFTESFTVTVAFNLPGGTVDVDASTTIALPLCPAQIPPDADTYVQHCDRSVDAYVAYDPTYPAGPTTFTFSGRGYTGVGPYEPVNQVVTVSPGQTAHAFFPADHAYSIQLAQENEHTLYGDSPLFSGVPQGCPYFPPPGSPDSQSSTPPTGATQAAGVTQPGQGVDPVSSGRPGGSSTGGTGLTGAQMTPDTPGASAAAPGVSANPTLSLGSQPTSSPPNPSQASAATPRSAAVWWPAAAGATLAVSLAGILIVRRRRVQLAMSRIEQPAAPDPENNDP